MLIFHCVTLAIFFFFQSLPSLGHVNHLFPILFLIFVFVFAFLLPYLAVTFYPTFLLPFWPFLSSTLPLPFTQRFHSLFGHSSPPLCCYSLPNYSTPILALLLPIFFSISYYRYSFSNSSPSFLSLLLPIISYLTVIISPPISLPFTLLHPILFSRNLLLIPLHLSLPFRLCSAYKTIWVLCFFLLMNFFLQLCLWVFVFWKPYFGLMCFDILV